MWNGRERVGENREMASSAALLLSIVAMVVLIVVSLLAASFGRAADVINAGLP